MDDKLSIKMAEIQKQNPSESYFDGEHFEGHGDKWDAIFGNIENYSEEKMRECINLGNVIFKQDINNKNYAGIVYPGNKPISTLSLIELKEECNEFTLSYPLMIGINNDVKLKESYMWEVNGEGEFAAETENEKMINFFDPFFAVDKPKFSPEKTQTISLAGLAYVLDKLEEKEFVLDHGNSYEFFRDEFLKNNPDKTEADFEPPVVKLDAENFRMMIPKKYACEYEIAAPIEKIEYTEILGVKFTIMKINLEHAKEDEYLYCNIYASEHVLGKYKPQVGDGISAIIWLTGFFN